MVRITAQELCNQLNIDYLEYFPCWNDLPEILPATPKPQKISRNSGLPIEDLLLELGEEPQNGRFPCPFCENDNAFQIQGCGMTYHCYSCDAQGDSTSLESNLC